jgi:hypothetical protein
VGNFHDQPWGGNRDRGHKDASYAERYGELCLRLEAEHLYDATCFLLSAEADRNKRRNYSEPVSACAADQFVNRLTAHVKAQL